MSNPDLLVLDEPTVAMDVESRHAFWSSMRAFAARGKTVLFATHYLEEADQNADRVVLMAHGRIVADGPPTEIKARVGSRTIRATLSDAASARRSPRRWRAPIIGGHGEAVVARRPDSDQPGSAACSSRLPGGGARTEIAGAGLEDAFLALAPPRPARGSANPSLARARQLRITPLRTRAYFRGRPGAVAYPRSREARGRPIAGHPTEPRGSLRECACL